MAQMTAKTLFKDFKSEDNRLRTAVLNKTDEIDWSTFHEFGRTDSLGQRKSFK